MAKMYTVIVLHCLPLFQMPEKDIGCPLKIEFKHWQEEKNEPILMSCLHWKIDE